MNCVVTSPPYWGLRDYGVSGQLGLEPTPEEYVANMVAVFREVRRVLRKDGTLWLNLGDSYAANRSYQVTDNKHVEVGNNMAAKVPLGLKPKDLVGIPWRVAFALQADGWYLRSDIIWSKPNPMPESVTDRPTKAHEYVFLMSKSPRYFYDADAIRTPLRPKTFTTFGTKRNDTGDGSGLIKSENYGRDVPVRKPKLKVPEGWNTEPGRYDGVPKGNGYRQPNPPVVADDRKALAGPTYERHRSSVPGGQDLRAEPLLAGANARTVWEIATQPYPEAHFATYPERLVEPCVKAGCPEDGIVLDPFVGSGTTLAVAQRFHRYAIGIELNSDYLGLIEDRLHGVRRKKIQDKQASLDRRAAGFNERYFGTDGDR